ncbi:MAG: AGE family epimerase/isomerase [Candidatus Latescibacterota bacterium]
MKRRSFIGAAIGGSVPGALALSCSGGQRKKPQNQRRKRMGVEDATELPAKISGMPLEDLRKDYNNRLFNQYLPFWEKGGIDKDKGGFMCLLNDDGTVADSEKYSWYQGRGLWVYSFLYNNFGKDKHYLDIATKARDFIVKYMYAGDGTWNERVNRDGSLKEGVGKNVYGWLFIAAGLQEFYRATGNDQDFKMVLETLWASLRTYDNAGYTGVENNGALPPETNLTGYRSQGHSMVIVWMLSQLLSHKKNSHVENELEDNVDYIMKSFMNPYLRITNEYLLHDYSRIPGLEDHMYTGHSIETQWIVMFEAIRQLDHKLFDECKEQIKRYLTLSWDYIFGGFGDGHFYVFDGPDRTKIKWYGVKSMWSHTEILLSLMHIIEYTGEQWAVDWYERVRAYSLKAYSTPYGVWRQAVDRFGNNIQRDGIPTTRKDNFHPARYMMLNILSLDRMIKNEGKLSSFR